MILLTMVSVCEPVSLCLFRLRKEWGGQNSYKGITILDSYVVLLEIMFNVHDSTHATYLLILNTY